MQKNYNEIKCEACGKIPANIGWKIRKKPVTKTWTDGTHPLIINESYVIITCGSCGIENEKHL